MQNNKLEIKCGDEPPWVRIPPSLPVKSRLRGDFHEAFSVRIFGEKQDFGHILGTRDFERGFYGARNEGS